MALNFPTTPSLNELFPPNPGVAGVTQYRWDGGKWVSALSTISLGTTNQGAYNRYEWPLTAGTAGYQLQSDGAGNLSWSIPAVASMEVLGLLEPFDGSLLTFTLVKAGTSTPFTPVPSTNIIVFLGGVPQLPTNSYSVVGNTLVFTQAPLTGTTFYAISNTVL
jgi:hypothetical protein